MSDAQAPIEVFETETNVFFTSSFLVREGDKWVENKNPSLVVICGRAVCGQQYKLFETQPMFRERATPEMLKYYARRWSDKFRKSLTPA